MHYRWIPLLLTAALAGCATTAQSPAPTAPPSLANNNLHSTLWMQTAAEYEAAAIGSFNNAIMQMEKALAEPGWDALPPAERAGLPLDGLPPAVIVDADETMIDNSPYQARGIREGRGFDLAAWQAWVNERRARAVPGAQAFARRAEELGVTIFFVTNRSHDGEREATEANLRALGYPLDEDGSNLILMGDPRASEHEKGSRRQYVGRTHRVLLLLGDNLGDFVDGYRGSIEQRQAAMAPYREWWGRRWIMLPNPSYGSWESAARQRCADAKAPDCLRSVLRYD